MILDAGSLIPDSSSAIQNKSVLPLVKYFTHNQSFDYKKESGKVKREKDGKAKVKSKK
jgi:hypothetical protein